MVMEPAACCPAMADMAIGLGVALMVNGVRFRTTGNNTEDCELAVTNVRLPDVPLATPVRLGVSVKVAGVVPVNADIVSHENGLVTVKLIGLPSLLFTDKVWAAGACRP